VPEGFAFIKMYWISSDPLLRTWISGARSYLDPVKPGSGIPGFGIAKVIKISKKGGKKTIIEVGDWVIGMLEWSEYMLVDYKIIQRLPLVLWQLCLGPRRAAVQVSDCLWPHGLHLLLVHQAGDHSLPDLEQNRE
jgi:hypothetical protein